MKTHLLLDIEGTTCPTSFVSNVLFPYAKDHLRGFISNNIASNNVADILLETEREWSIDNDPLSIELKTKCQQQHLSGHEALIQYLHLLINQDRKSTSLKDLQGLIWDQGYAKRELQVELFPEAAGCLKEWNKAGIVLSVYSSGSIKAQKLLYRYTTSGDLTQLFHQWFDTHTGPKKNASSYTKIVNALQTQADQIWFVSDNGAECDAAKFAGLKTLFSLRAGNPDQNPRGHTVIHSLTEVTQRIKETQ